MGRSQEVPVTASVLRWAIAQSGYSWEELARHLDVDVSVLRGWAHGVGKPGVTQFKELVAKLKRTQAFFLLPAPPVIPEPDVSFRHPLSATRTDVNPAERRYLREAARMQRAVAWVVDELKTDRATLPKYVMNGNAEASGAEARAAFRVPAAAQMSWSSSSQAFKEWRTRFEEQGVLVFLFQMGKEASRGFSLWHARAPVIAINTWWNPEARIFTLFHEYGHLLTRTSSVCSTYRRWSKLQDPVERWCEKFAAASLLPWRDVTRFMEAQLGWSPGSQISTLDDARYIANRFKVSLRAAVLRLIENDVASWDLFREIPVRSDDKEPSGGGKGRFRAQAQEDKYGGRTRGLIVNAVRKDVISRTDALSLMDVPDSDFEGWLEQ